MKRCKFSSERLAFKPQSCVNSSEKICKKILITFFSIALSASVLAAGNDTGTSTFIETYDDGTDVGLWHCSVGVPRILETSGGNPGTYL
jgi:hypothetical protein